MNNSPAGPKIALLFPAYNEEKTIAATIRDFFSAIPDATFCVIDNNSADRTAAVAVETAQSLSGCEFILLRERRQGKAMAIRHAFKTIDADIYVMIDADNTYSAADLPALLKPVIEGCADMVVGDRHAAGHYEREIHRPMHGFGNQLVRNLINRLFRANLHDILSGYRVFSRGFVKSFPILSAGFELETEITLHALDKRFRILELPINYRDRPVDNPSKLSTFRDGRKVLTALFSILRYNKPLFFFGSVSSILAILGVSVGVIPVLEYFRTGMILHLPSAVLASALMICSLVMLAIALILDSVSRIDRQNFELHLITMHTDSQRQ